ncbi:MAG: hypothetical protein NWQ32_01365, partial [Paracoccaceae bacterium]|nr:hypothetical protein [Paracoccaceae bacterium]
MAQTMTAAQAAGHGRAAPGVRLLGWLILALMAAFLINNVLNVGYGTPVLAAALGDMTQAGAIVPIGIYAACLGIAIGYVLATGSTVLRTDGQR